MNDRKSLYNWLGLAVLALLVVGLVYLTARGRPEAESDEPSSPLSPLPTDLSSPLDSPLPAKAPLPTATPPPPMAAPPPPLQLTVLHSNDTWGYLLPCG